MLRLSMPSSAYTLTGRFYPYIGHCRFFQHVFALYFLWLPFHLGGPCGCTSSTAPTGRISHKGWNRVVPANPKLQNSRRGELFLYMRTVCCPATKATPTFCRHTPGNHTSLYHHHHTPISYHTSYCRNHLGKEHGSTSSTYDITHPQQQNTPGDTIFQKKRLSPGVISFATYYVRCTMLILSV